MGKGGVEIQPAGGLFLVDIDRVGVCIVKGSREVEGRCAVGFQTGGERFYGRLSRFPGDGREASAHSLLKVQQHLGSVLVGE